MNKIKGLTIQFLPYAEIEKLDSTGRIRKLLDIILKGKIIVLQGRLKAEEETRLIEDTMIMIGNIKGFKGVELAVISQDSNDKTEDIEVLENLDSDRNLVGFFSILLEEARRIDPEKYLEGYVKNK